MKIYKHSLVIGKFYPPHAGHHYLIRTAANHSEFVTVVVMAASHESIPLDIRVVALRDAFSDYSNVTFVGVIDDIPVDYHDTSVWEKHVALMKMGVARAHENSNFVPVDAVFTSESYGEQLASYFNAVPVCLDQSRQLYPVSGTKVRHSPIDYWQQLDASIRAWMALRVVIVGAESTGKTTLAKRLAGALNARGGVWERVEYVPEFGREHTHNKLALAKANARAFCQDEPAIDELVWSSPEFEFIARRQQQMEEEAARRGGPVLVADTDVFATSIWHERYIGVRSDGVEALQPGIGCHRIYLLTDVGSVPFEQDGVRDGEDIREWMHQTFTQRLIARGYAWRLLVGDKDDFLRQAIQCVDEALASAWRFADPLG